MSLRTESGPAPPVSRRDRQRSERRDRVYRAAMELFTEHGYEQTTMDDIAERSGVARTSVFNYFARKSAFLDEWTARPPDRSFEGFDSAASAPLAQQLRQVMTSFAVLSAQTRPETVALINAAVRELDLLDYPALGIRLAELIKKHRGELRDGIDPDLSGLVLATSYFAVLRAWCKVGPEPFDLEERLKQVVELIVDGMTRDGSQ